MINGVHTLNVLLEVAEERHAQDERWGQQDHPVHTPGREAGLPVLNGTYADVERELKWAFSQGERSGAVILLEEVMEALNADGPRHQRQELIQVAAVAVMMVEAIDRASQGMGSLLDAVRSLSRLDNINAIPDTFKAPSQDCPHCGNAYLVTRLAGHIRAAHPETLSVPLADMVSRVVPDIQLTEDQKRVLDALPDATLEIDLTPIPFLKEIDPTPDEQLQRDRAFREARRWVGHGTDPYDAVGGDLEALERARNALHRAPVCGREAATARPCPEHAPAPVVVMPHAYNGNGRLHGICRCGEGPDDPIHRPDPHPFMATYGDACHCFQLADAPTHRCLACDHPFHPAEQPCMELIGPGPGNSQRSCGCGRGE